MNPHSSSMSRQIACVTIATSIAIMAIGGLLQVGAPEIRAELVEEIVARVNDDPITRSDLTAAEREAVEEIYGRKSGGSLDKDIERAKTELLRDLITKRLLIQQAERMYDIAKMQDAYMRQFKEQQKIGTTAELERTLREEGYTLEEFRRKIVEVNAPGSVINMEVRDKISVSDAEVEAYYKAHHDDLSSVERLSYREILVRTDNRTLDEARAIARGAAERARDDGADFTGIAKELSEVDPKLRGVLLGPFGRGELAPELETAIFALKAGDVSEPIETGPALHIVRVDQHDESAIPSLEAIREKLSDAIEREKFGKALDAYIIDLWKHAEIHVPDEYLVRLQPEFRKYVK